MYQIAWGQGRAEGMKKSKEKVKKEKPGSGGIWRKQFPAGPRSEKSPAQTMFNLERVLRKHFFSIVSVTSKVTLASAILRDQ